MFLRNLLSKSAPRSFPAICVPFPRELVDACLTEFENHGTGNRCQDPECANPLQGRTVAVKFHHTRAWKGQTCRPELLCGRFSCGRLV